MKRLFLMLLLSSSIMAKEPPPIVRETNTGTNWSQLFHNDDDNTKLQLLSGGENRNGVAFARRLQTRKGIAPITFIDEDTDMPSVKMRFASSKSGTLDYSIKWNLATIHFQCYYNIESITPVQIVPSRSFGIKIVL